MKNIIYILNVLFFSLSIIYSEDSINIAWFNFYDIEVDEKNEILFNLSNQISKQFIDIAKKDMMFIDNINFIPTKQLDREYKKMNGKIVDAIIPSFKENFSGSIDRNNLAEKINIISDRFSLGQINFLTDSVIVYIDKSTKNITTDMMDINDGLSNTDMNILDNLISKEIGKTLKKHAFSSFITSTKESFQTDIIITASCSIIQDEININLYLYNYKDFSFIDSIHSKSFINKTHILMKDLEFKLLSKLGVDIDQNQKEKLCQYDLDFFSKKHYSLYFSNIFESSDIQEIKYRLQMNDQYDFLSAHYQTFFSSLVDKRIGYIIKLYDDDNYYNVYSTESSNNSSVAIDVLRSDWKSQVGGISITESVSNQKRDFSKSQRIVNIEYNKIESIYFNRGQDNLVSLLKQIAIYSSIIGAVFLLNMLI